ncbi:MAG TPA: 1-acyl-sn-glycerol-3-phosphate acyltransferase [Solirubrobacteraceae bacterium]|nr:1-acyl-sn-glycerol-3-phosphate acyltransferase [Solirubrobacteraceae bacterium]
MPVPRLVRRVVFPVLVVLVALLVFTTIPLLVMAAAIASPFLPGRRRALRVLMFALVYLALETLVLAVLGMLWLAAGFGRRIDSPRMQDAHYRLAAWFLRVLMLTARRAFKVRIEVHGSAPPPLPPVPLIVLSRHAGPGDSFLLMHQLMNAERRQPRIVLKDALQWDPLADILLNRLPAHFVSASHPRERAVAEIARLATGMDADDALVIFPEGGNFTEHRRRRSIAKLEELGRYEEARRARELDHLLAPRSGGVLAALEGCPTADVVLVAHTGLEDLSTVVDLWRGLPLDDDIDIRMWHVAAADVPPEEAGRITWLGDWWQRMDEWISTERPPAGKRDGS